MKRILLLSIFTLLTQQTFCAFKIDKPAVIKFMEKAIVPQELGTYFLHDTIENHFENYQEEFALFFRRFKGIHDSCEQSKEWFLSKEKNYCAGIELTLKISPLYKDQAETMRKELLQKLKAFYALYYAKDPRKRTIYVVIKTEIRPMRAKL